MCYSWTSMEPHGLTCNVIQTSVWGDIPGQGRGYPAAGMKREELFQGLVSLRKGLLQSAILLLILSMIIFPFSTPLLHRLYEANLRVDLVAFGVPEAFLSLVKLSFYSSLFLSIPFLFYHLWGSFSPFFRRRGLTARLPILFTAILLFYLGALFCYFVTLPFGIQFLLKYQTAEIKPMISVGKYISFCFIFVFAFGLTFELPLVLALLSSVGVVRASFLTRNRRYAILLITILSAVITPTPDVFNLSLMGGPLYVLFEVGVLLVKMIERRKRTAPQETEGLRTEA